MTYMKNIICLLLIFFFLLSCQNQSIKNEDYKNPDLSVELRVRDLLSRMTLEEKFWQMFMIPGDLSLGKEKLKHGIFGFQVATAGQSKEASGQLLTYDPGTTGKLTAEKINEIQKYFIEETRLGIPIIAFDEALHGLVRQGATAFPQAIGLAATWDTGLMEEVAKAIAMECKTRGIRQILSPVLNIARDVRWGRTEETYGEDPFLTTQMGLAFISTFESNEVITTPKHFVVNVGDGGRDSYPIHLNERLLREIYFPAFRACFQGGGARSVMMSYNSLDGTPCTANSWLMRDLLKKEWGFEGFVISDAGGTGGANVLHFTTDSYAESTQKAIESGLDVIFQTSYQHYPLFWEAFEKGLISESVIDEAVSRILNAKFELGLFEDPYVDPDLAAETNGIAAHRILAHRAAVSSVVLLKNDQNLLPLNPNFQSIALIGTDAVEGRLGGYSGPGNQVVTILEGLRTKAENKNINYHPGPGRHYSKYKIISAEHLNAAVNDSVVRGLQGSYFDNITLSGDPKIIRNDAQLNFGWTLYGPDPELAYDWYSVRWEGSLVSPLTGKFEIGIEGDDGYRLYIDDRLVLNRWDQQGYGTHTVPIHFIKNKDYKVRVEFFTGTGNSRIKLIWNMGVEDETNQKITEAVNMVKTSDVAIVVAGIEEGEFRDRASLSLPGKQEELLTRLIATRTPVIVVLIGGSAVNMSKWIKHVDAVLQGWYPGEMGGMAIADILLGNHTPGGKLPITFPKSEGQLPLVYNHKPTGRGDDYLDSSGKPLFPFGYGLSYTQFSYDSLKMSQSSIMVGDSVKISCRITNTGAVKGDEVVQLYIRDELASVARPVKELKGFQRISLESGESADCKFILGPSAFEMLDQDLNLVIEPGEFRIMIGSSSRDIRLRGIVEVSN